MNRRVFTSAGIGRAAIGLFVLCIVIHGPLSNTYAAQPVADAGSDQAVAKSQLCGSTVLLDGRASYDDDGDPLTFRWYGPFATTSGSVASVPIPEGRYTVSLTADDGTSPTDIDTAAITVSPCFSLSPRAKRGKVEITWTHRDGTQRYDIYRSTESDPFTFEKIGESTSTYSVYMDYAVSNETTYLYAVEAVCECNGDFDNDGDVDGTDLAVFAADVGRTDCGQGEPCEGDFNGVGNIDDSDFALFSANFGQSGCTSCYSDIVSAHPTASRPPANSTPVIYSFPITNGTTGIVYNYDVHATDPNEDALTYSLSTYPDDMEIDPATGLITWTPAQTGDYGVTVDITDGHETDSQTFTITVVDIAVGNLAPVVDAGPDQTHTLMFGQTEREIYLNGNGSHDPDGTIAAYVWTGESGAPDPDDVAEPTVTLTAGAYIFTLVATDDDGAVSNPDSVTITVNEAPDVGNPPEISVDPLSYTVAEGESVTISVSAIDPQDDDVVTLSASPKLSNCEFTAVPGNPATGAFAFNPDYDQQGIYVVAFKARDPLGLTDTKTVQITVTNINRAPTISASETLEVDEGGLLTIPIQTSDPDGDILTLTAAPLPDNSIFIPATGTITFAPDFDQAGPYEITCTASDGALSAGQPVQVTVNDVPGATGEPQELILTVDPVESPTFLTTQRITGAVNASSTAQPQRITCALITGMNPATGEQGQTLDITLTGQADGDFATHFADGISLADFGSDITVNSITVNSSTEAVVNITVDSDAAEGPRSVNIVSENETAVSVLAFNVTKGQAGLTGTLIDPDTGQPIAGAIITIQGTHITTVTNADGVFTFTDVPTGEHVIIINAQDHELITMAISSQVGVTSDIGSVESSSTVFDPSAPPSVNIFSIIGRGAGLMIPKLDKPELEQMIIDTILLVGENQAGIIDEYGNQLNPELAADAQISLTSTGVEQIADRMLRNETMSLSRLLFAFSQGFQWGGAGERMSLENWLQLVQEIVNQAWTDPTNPDNYLPVIIFSNKNILSPEAPQISHLTRLNALQAYLFSSSLFACMNEMTP